MSTQNLTNFFVRTKIQQCGEMLDKYFKPLVEFNLPKSGKVNLVLSDLSGRKVLTVVDNEVLQKGHYCKEMDFSGLPGGEYFYKFSMGNFEERRELKLFK